MLSFGTFLCSSHSRSLCCVGTGWRPHLAAPRLGKVLTVEGASEYVTRVEKFFIGELDASEIGNGLDR